MFVESINFFDCQVSSVPLIPVLFKHIEPVKANLSGHAPVHGIINYIGSLLLTIFLTITFIIYN